MPNSFRGNSESVLLAQLTLLHILTEQEDYLTTSKLVKAMEDRGVPVSLRRIQRYMNTFVFMGLARVLPGDARTNYGGRRYVKSGKLALIWEPES